MSAFPIAELGQAHKQALSNHLSEQPEGPELYAEDFGEDPTWELDEREDRRAGALRDAMNADVAAFAGGFR